MGSVSVAAPALTCGLLLACALVPASARAVAGGSDDGSLSPRLAELARPAVRSAPPVKQARRLSLAPHGPGSLLRDGNRVLVDVRFDHGAAAGVDGLRAAGAKVVNISRRYQTVTVAAEPAELQALAVVPHVAAATEVLTPIAAAGPSCPSGPVVSEGDTQLHAAQARNEFGVDGTGVTVGILSDSFDRATEAVDGSGPVATHAANDVEMGDLPGAANPCGQGTPVAALDDSESEGADEGRAMAQIVHDLAPGANLAFATAFTGELSFAENIERLAKPASKGGTGAQVIADDVTYFDEPFFQDGPVSVAVNNVTGSGVSYLSSAGNDNLIEAGTGNEIASWEAPGFRDSSSCPAALAAIVELNALHCMDFDPGAGVDNTFGVTVEEEETLTVDLQWAEPWFGVNTDIDMFLLDDEGKLVKVGGSPVWSVDDNPGEVEAGGTQEPFEFFQWENPGPAREVQLAINRYSGGDPRLKLVLLQNGGGVSATEYPASSGGDTVGPTIFGHNGAGNAISVGAIRYSTNSAPEEFSSRGPVTHYFGPVAGLSPAAALPSPKTLEKPDLVATDCGVTTFFAFQVEGKWRFCGTSAAAPHAAAVAALLRDANPSLSPMQVREALATSALPVGVFGLDAVGAGLVDAPGAVGQVAEAGSPEEEAAASGAGEATTQPEAVLQTEGHAPAGGEVADRRTLRTFFLWHPPRLIRTRHRRARAVFRFGANERPVTFVCRVDGGLFRFCGRRYARRFRVGLHVVRVMARDAAGHFDRTPAVYRFRVKRRRTR